MFSKLKIILAIALLFTSSFAFSQAITATDNAKVLHVGAFGNQTVQGFPPGQIAMTLDRAVSNSGCSRASAAQVRWDGSTVSGQNALKVALEAQRSGRLIYVQTLGCVNTYPHLWYLVIY
ncbi:hypothetical protein [Sessilibacter corallicola]|uniref:hypothetical protein n=1 Tax=Sessilibacter corallicola TaxID=2904075 RepID=UPI001E3C1A46|nr:hypothetical protein [Sessilibacter corallicola]MCE2026711.1 hypothetical protein [Sessilibacter corallicola]